MAQDLPHHRRLRLQDNAPPREWVDATPGLEKIKLALPTGSDRAAAVSITNLMSPHRATDLDVLERCVKAIDLNDERLADYDTWCALLRAICAACGGDMPFFAETVLPWLQTNTSNLDNDGASRMEDKWKSFTDSQLGAQYLYQWTAQFNCGAGLQAMAQGCILERGVPLPNTGAET
jgi:hypothetical protein